MPMSSGWLRTHGWVHAIAFLLLGCASLQTGARAPWPAPTPEASSDLRRVGTDEVDGVRVLWNAAASGRAPESQSWAASDQVELEALWRRAGAMAPMPSVDFTRYVVFGLSH